MNVNRQGGMPLEVAIAKYWANIGEVTVSYSVEFHGVRPDCGARLSVAAAGGLRRVALSALRHQDLQPHAVLKYAEPVLRCVSLLHLLFVHQENPSVNAKTPSLTGVSINISNRATS
jgi:hypothetical protein